MTGKTRGKYMVRKPTPKSKHRPHEVIVAERDQREDDKRAAIEAKIARLSAKIKTAEAKLAPHDPAWIELAKQRIREDPAWWFKTYVWTNDPHDNAEPVKRFPWDKGYFQFQLDTLLEDKIVFCAKSSKVLASWFGSGLLLWKALFFKHAECYLQCMSEDAVNYFIKTRIKPTYELLPEWQKPKGTTFKFCYMDVPGMSSFIEGIPSGVDKIRGRAPSLFVLDELAFQDNGDMAVASALPRILGDAMFFGVSTPNMKNPFHARIFPEKKLLESSHPIEGYPKTEVRKYKGQTVIFLHYSCDPDKRSAEWKDEQYARMVADGNGEEKWRQEMELDFTATGKPKLFPTYDPAIHEAKVEFDPFRPLYRGMDFAYTRPAIVFFQKNRFDQIVILHSILGGKWDIHEFARHIWNVGNKRFLPGKSDGRTIPVRYRDACDHSGKAETHLGNAVRILNQYQIKPISRYSYPEERASLISDLLAIRSDGKPGLIVNEDDSLMTQGFRGSFSYKPDGQNYATGIPHKDGYYEHLLDGFGYGLDNYFNVRTRERTPDEISERKRRRRAHRKKYEKSLSGYLAVGV